MGFLCPWKTLKRNNSISAGSTTFKREDHERGFEPDASFYLQHAAAIRHNVAIDLASDPPPDLILAIALTHPSLNKFPLHAALGIPEIWRYAGGQLTIYRRGLDGYQQSDASGVLPGVTPAHLEQHVATGYEMPRPAWLRRVRAWAASLLSESTSQADTPN